MSNKPVGKRPPMKKGVLPRLIKMLVKDYPVLIPINVSCIIFAALVSVVPALFMQKITEAIVRYQPTGDYAAAAKELIPQIIVLACIYLVSICIITLDTQLTAIITQGFLSKMRIRMFRGMQNLPIKYFDTHKHGDIMSYYTNDIDTLRQLISQSIPTLIRSTVIVFSVLGVMLWYSVWLTLVLLIGVALMLFVSKKAGGGAAKYFINLQRSVADLEGYAQEMMNGQKVVKVFGREEKCREEFERINENLCEQSTKAHGYSNILGPVIMNIGNVMYVIIATVGGIFMLIPNFFNLNLSGLPFGVDLVVPFLNMTKQFTGNINQVSQQINSIVMAMAGANRIFELIDEEPECDEGYVTLVNARIADDGSIEEVAERTGIWAWRHPHGDGSVTYTRLCGDVRMEGVDFEYEEGKPILRDVSVYAEPGQKVAFVGATGAGKTTITNLINRYYDIADGKIRYDGINVNKIKKSDLRRSLGIVLQETNLFTGTVMDNIRYGKLEATDEECITAAKLAGADSFITRLPEGYNTELSGNGANLSQGQRQLIAIARAAVADPPVMILDEATSSIDTRTEAIVQAGMDKLMEGRTVFVIAHRLSTVRNSDVIMVLDHGKIIERGSHDKLISERGTYYRLYTGAFELE